jgi:hypothetical protein
MQFNMATTQEVFDHHVQGFVERSVPMVLEDFIEDSALIENGQVFEGLGQIAAVFTQVFTELPADCDFVLTECIVRDRFVYIVWNAESNTHVYEFAADTFVIEDGKITLQTVGAVVRAK